MSNKNMPTVPIEDSLPDYSRLIDFYFTREYSQTYSINYQEGDPYINEFRHFWTVVASMIGQTSGEEDLRLVYEKNLFKITCPFFTGEEDFYLESLDYYLLFYGFYNTINIVSLLEKSLNNLLVSNFYNKDGFYLYCFYNDTYSDYNFELTDKLEKNTKLIQAMNPLLWQNGYYTLKREALTVGGTSFLVNGEELILDIVNELSMTPTPKDFVITPAYSYIRPNEVAEFTVDLFGGLLLSSLQVVSSDEGVATVQLQDGSTIGILGVSQGMATISVRSDLTPTRQDLSVKVNSSTIDITPTKATVKLLTDPVATFQLSNPFVDFSTVELTISDNTIISAELKNNNSAVEVTGLKQGDSYINVTASTTPYSSEVRIHVAPTPYKGAFSATDSVRSMGELFFINLNTSTGELTTEAPNGSNVVVCGVAGREPFYPDIYNPTGVVVEFLAESNPYLSTIKVRSDPTLPPSVGDGLTIDSNGSAVSPGNGYSVPGCLISSYTPSQYLDTPGMVTLSLEQDVSDILLLNPFRIDEDL
jgi:hypothetical protein